MTPTATRRSLDELRRSVANEQRTLQAEVRWQVASDDPDNLRIQGHAAVFDSESVNIGFIETLAPGCFTRALARSDLDLYLLLGHDPDAILARTSAGTLHVRQDEHGLAFDADVVPTQLGKDVAYLVRTGHLTGCSFKFTVAKDQWSERGATVHRRVLEVGQLFELTLTGIPAYPASQVEAARTISEHIHSLRQRAEALRAQGGTMRPAQAITVREREAYGPGSRHSYFRDLATVQAADRRKDAAALDPHLRGRDPGALLPPSPARRGDGSVKDARRRLAAAQERALSTSTGAGGEFAVPAGVPAFIATHFTTSARAAAVLPRVVQVLPLPPAGTDVEMPLFVGGASAAVQAAQGDAVSETDPTTSAAKPALGTIAGQVDMSQQLWDRAPNLDTALAAELGRAYGERLDVQAINGSGAAGQLLGLLNVPGHAAVVYDDASPTAAEFFAKLGEGYADLADAFGAAPDAILMRPSRKAWVVAKLGYLPEWPAEVFEVPAIPPTLSTNQDAVILLVRGETTLWTDPPKFRVHEEPLDNTLQVRCQVYGYAALGGARQPKSIAVVGGTGLVAPPTF